VHRAPENPGPYNNKTPQQKKTHSGRSGHFNQGRVPDSEEEGESNNVKHGRRSTPRKKKKERFHREAATFGRGVFKRAPKKTN